MACRLFGAEQLYFTTLFFLDCTIGKSSEIGFKIEEMDSKMSFEIWRSFNCGLSVSAVGVVSIHLDSFPIEFSEVW